MDILTKKGQETLAQVKDALKIWHKHYPLLCYNETPENKPADIDGIITSSGTIRAIAEMKCRVSISLRDFEDWHDGEWLVTFDKVTRGISLSKSLQVPFVGFLYFPIEKTLLVQKIYDPDNGIEVKMEVRRTQTQATVNGGKIWRDNAYIDMMDAKRLT